MKKIDFLATDGIILNGFLYNNKSTTKDIVLAVHGMSSNAFKDREEKIAEYANRENIDFFGFNNRGSELVKYIRKEIDGKKEKMLGGTTYEDVLEGYEDIVGAMIKLKELGYENIYLLGHSLGCTKIVYTYKELQEERDDLTSLIKGIMLLSLIDIPRILKIYLKENYNKYLEYAEEKEQEGKKHEIMPSESFIHPISVKTFLRYARDNKEFDFAQYSKDNQFKVLNSIKVPLFMRWGTNKEMIEQNAQELVIKLKNAIHNKDKDIDYIEGTDHSYKGKEEQLAEQIIRFINKT